ncbi:unnamed protein product [Hyaloperonospora brassicae]|uniref:RxLR effector candidate protein n=1 Tax=Hyaloperonospora brassicae TaxID=162125 RepID=A0AAV0UXR0_HYABA|nr:unnamed protein product [Hyaloperonospora brassicae]
MLPMIKLGGLVARTLTKPLARVVKTRAKVHPLLRAVCTRLGQQQHRVTMQLHMGFRGISSYTIKPVSPDEAVDQGADLIGELLIFAVALGVASLEYSRAAASARAKEAKQKEQQQREERAVELRFASLESHVAWLEDRLVALTSALESERGETLEQLQAQQTRREAARGEETRRETAGRGRGRPAATERDGQRSLSVAQLWTSTQDAVTRLFK